MISNHNDCKEELDSVKKSTLYQKNYAQKRKLEQVTEERDELLKRKEEDLLEITFMKETVETLKKRAKSEQSIKSKYKNDFKKVVNINNDLCDMLEKESEVKIREDGSSHRYSDDIRRAFYTLQGQDNVAASNCSAVVSTVAKILFHTDLSKDKLPSKTTALNFANEAGVIAQHQVVDEIKKSDHFMFASDATSRQKAHYLEQHIQLSNGKVLFLGFSQIASDNSETLLEKCSSMFHKLCLIHCSSNDDDLSSLFKETISKLMSDRASVMKSFDKKFAQYKYDLLDGEDCSTHFLFCNAHFLLALSAAAEKAISTVEKDMTEGGEKLGRDANYVYKSFENCSESAAVRSIQMASECLGPRGDEKSGSRQEWLQFCSLQTNVCQFTSYRSNRFNNLFQNATALLHHKSDILLFLTEYVSHSNLKLQSVVADLKDKRVMSGIAALSFFHIYFKEPYWLLMNSQKTYLDFPHYVRKMEATLILWSSEEFVFSKATSVFSDFKTNDKASSVIEKFF